MNLDACRRRIGQAETAEAILALLNNPPDRCADCSDSAALRTVCEQYQMRTPHGWLVNGALAVPIWAVELLDRHLLTALPSARVSPHDRHAVATA